MTSRMQAALALAVAVVASPPVMAAKTTTVIGRVVEVQEERRFVSGRQDEVSQTLVVRTKSRGDLAVGLSSQTHYLRWITHQAWRQSTRADASFLKPGRLVAVHFSDADEHPIARLVRVATE